MKKLPKFKSAKEEREFWETHEALDYFDPKDFVPLAPLIKGVKLSHIYVAPDGSRWEVRKLRPKRTALAHNPPSPRSKSRKKKVQSRREPFLVR